MRYIITTVFIISSLLFTQDNTPYYLSTTYDKYIEYLIFSNKIDITHPLNQPYTVEEINNSFHPIDENNTWLSDLNKELNKYVPPTSLKQNLIVGFEGLITGNYKDTSIVDDYAANLFLSYNYKNIAAYLDYDANTLFIDDSLYFGSVGKFENDTFGRIANSYIKYNQQYINIFYGRINRNFGLINTYSLIQSDNPYSYDHFLFDISNDDIKYSFLTSRLEDIYGYDVRNDSIPNYDWYKRFITIHRLEIAISKKLDIAITESILYGGINQSWISMYINPMNIYFLNKMSDRKGLEETEANALMAIEFMYKPIKNITLYTQFLVDDIDFTESLRSIYPDRLGIYSKIVLTDLFPKSLFYLDYIRISNWTYNSFYTFGNYIYYSKSMGYPKNGVENFTLGFNYFNIPNFIISLKTQYTQERLQDITSPFIAEKSKFPIGISQETIGTNIEIDYIPKSNISVKMNVEYSHYNNYLHMLRDNHSNLGFYLSLIVKDIYSITKNK